MKKVKESDTVLLVEESLLKEDILNAVFNSGQNSLQIDLKSGGLTFLYTNTAGFPSVGDSKFLYFDRSTDTMYKWVTATSSYEPILGSSLIEFQNAILAIQTDNTLDPGATPSLRDRYIITDKDELNANFGVIVGLADNDIVEYNGSEFVVSHVPSAGSFTSLVTVSTYLLYFNGTIWEPKYFESTTASNGVKKVGFDIQGDFATEQATREAVATDKVVSPSGLVAYSKIKTVSFVEADWGGPTVPYVITVNIGNGFTAVLAQVFDENNDEVDVEINLTNDEVLIYTYSKFIGKVNIAYIGSYVPV